MGVQCCRGDCDTCSLKSLGVDLCVTSHPTLMTSYPILTSVSWGISDKFYSLPGIITRHQEDIYQEIKRLKYFRYVKKKERSVYTTTWVLIK